MANIDSLPRREGSTREKESTPSSVTINLSRGGEYSIDPIQATPLEVRGGDGIARAKMIRYATIELAPGLESEITTNDPNSAVVDIWTAQLGEHSRTFVAPHSINLEDNSAGRQVWFLEEGDGIELGRKTGEQWQQKTGKQLPTTVSGKHLVIRRKDGQIFITDQHSSNGTLMEVGIVTTQEKSTPTEGASERLVSSLGSTAGNLLKQAPEQRREGLSDDELRSLIALNDTLKMSHIQSPRLLEDTIRERLDAPEGLRVSSDIKTLQRLMIAGAAQGLETRRAYSEEITADIAASGVLSEEDMKQITTYLSRVSAQFDRYPSPRYEEGERTISGAGLEVQDNRRREGIIDDVVSFIDQARRPFENASEAPKARQTLAYLSALEAGILSLRAHGKARDVVYDIQNALKGDLDITSKQKKII